MASTPTSRPGASRRAGVLRLPSLPRPAWLDGARGSLVLGAGAAAACAALYYALRAASGYELTVLAVGVGVAVGYAVRHGAGRSPRGRPVQALAVALTFAAVALARRADVTTSELELLAHSTRGAARSAAARVADQGPDPCADVPDHAGGVVDQLWAEADAAHGGPAAPDRGEHMLARLCTLRRTREESARLRGESPGTGALGTVAAVRRRAAIAVANTAYDGSWLRATLAGPFEEILFGTPLAALGAAVLLLVGLRRAWRLAGAE